MTEAINPIWLCTTKVKRVKNNNETGVATAFFYSYSGQRFLITNRHVVIDEQRGLYPDSLRIRVHSSPNDLVSNEDLTIPLYDAEGIKLWQEHPRAHVDVVALKLSDILGSTHITRTIQEILSSQQIFFPKDVVEEPTDVMILGYPEGFHDAVNNLPVLRSGMVATAHSVPFEGKPYFFVDARLHEGMSGGPVFSKPESRFRNKNRGFRDYMIPLYWFLGIISHGVPPTVEPNPLGVNRVWFAHLIEEILSQ